MLPASYRPGVRFGFVILSASGLILAVLLCASKTAAGSENFRWRQDLSRAGNHSAWIQSSGDCGPETYPKILLEEHVETGAAGWTHGGMYDDLWEISSWRPYSGTYSWYVPALDSINDQSLFSPLITLPEGELPLSLRFWGYRDLENSYSGCYDGALLEISTDGGQSWIQLDSQLQSDPYDGLIDSASQNPLAGRPAWCGHPLDWLESIVLLDEFAGQTVQFRFRVGTDNSQSREGWYLDDIVIQSCPSAYIAQLDPDSAQSGTPGEQVSHDIRLENLGLDDQFTFHLLEGVWPASLVTSSTVTLLSGQVFTASVIVDLPALPGGQLLEDIFILEAQSTGNPGLILQSTGISELQITPGTDLNSAQAFLVGVPGQTLTHTFSLTNTGDAADNFYLALDGAEWPAYVSPNSGMMQAGEAKTIHVAVTIPTGPWKTVAPVITDTFKLHAESGWSAQVNAEAASSTSAGLVAGLSIDGPSFMDAFVGQSIELVFSIENLGNFADQYSLEWEGDWLAEIPDSQTDWILAGDSVEIPVRMIVPPQTQDGETSSISLTATSQLDETKSGNILLTIYGWRRIFLPLIRQ